MVSVFLRVVLDLYGCYARPLLGFKNGLSTRVRAGTLYAFCALSATAG